MTTNDFTETLKRKGFMKTSVKEKEIQRRFEEIHSKMLNKQFVSAGTLIRFRDCCIQEGRTQSDKEIENLKKTIENLRETNINIKNGVFKAKDYYDAIAEVKEKIEKLDLTITSLAKSNYSWE